MKVDLCTPVYRDPSFYYTTSLVALVIETRNARPDIELRCSFTRGTGLEIKRAALAQGAIDRGADYTLWIDADQQFPPDALLRLLSHGKEMVGCNILTCEDNPRPNARGGDFNGLRTKDDSPPLEEVSAIGFGVLLVATDVFRKVPKPWFVSSDNGGEDIRFCLAAKQAGCQVWVDHDLSREIGHVGEKIYRL